MEESLLDILAAIIQCLVKHAKTPAHFHYLLVHLSEGGVSLTINQRSGKLDTQVRAQGLGGWGAGVLVIS